jgi:hypothetical protein
MSIETPSIPTASDQPKKKNCLLWGCLSVVILVVVTFCCLGSLVIVPFVTDFDPFNLRGLVEDNFNLGDYLDGSSQFPGFDDFLDDDFDFDSDEGSYFPDESESESADLPESYSDASSIPLEYYSASDFSATFLYPSGWEIEVEDSAVTFYEPDSFTYLWVGEDVVDEGYTAAQIASDLMESIREESQEGTFQLVSSMPWMAEDGEDAHLNLMEWTDLDGYYTWAYDLEIVLGEYNNFFFISGEEPEDIALYGDLLEIIVDSFSRQ